MGRLPGGLSGRARRARGQWQALLTTLHPSVGDAVILVASGLMIGLLALVAWQGDTNGATLQVHSRGRLVAELPLERNGEYRVQGALGESVIRIRDGAGMLIESPCPNGICLHHWLRRSGQVTACLPNRVLLAVTGSRNGPGVIDGWAF